MPGGDRTGPMGMGPMTGRGAGYCAGYPTPGFMNPVPGYGYGRGFGWGGGRGFGRGGGRGWRHRFWATGLPGWARGPFSGWLGYGPPVAPTVAPTVGPEQELQALKTQADQLQAMLSDIRARIGELEAAEPAE